MKIEDHTKINENQSSWPENKINNSRIDLSFEKFNLKNTHQMYDAGSLGNINLDTTNSIIKLTVVSVL